MKLDVVVGFWMECPKCHKGIFFEPGHKPPTHDCGFDLEWEDFVNRMKNGDITMGAEFTCPDCEKEQVIVLESHKHQVSNSVIMHGCKIEHLQCIKCGTKFYPEEIEQVNESE